VGTVTPVPERVLLHVWRVPGRQVPAAVSRLALDRRLLRRTPGLSFAKGMGTGDGRTFTVRDSDPRRWALLTTWQTISAAEGFATSPVVLAWSRLAEESWRVDLRPLASRGRWSRQEPFGDPVPQRWDGPVAALTRARLVLRRAAAFWRAVPPVSADLQGAPGLRLALGVGEAPVGLQGTFSLWDSASALRRFAYEQPAHVEAVRRTATDGWYAEELFARFAVLASAGTLGGQDPAREVV